MRKTTFLSLLITLCFVGLQTLSAQPNNRLFFVFLNTNPDKPVISEEKKESLQAQHLGNLDNLADQGILKAAGPFDGGGGLLILQAETEAEAWEIVNTDPAVKADRFKVEVLPFALNGNQLCGAKEPYEMVTYQFVRLISDVEFFGDIKKMVHDDRFFMAGDARQRFLHFIDAQANFVAAMFRQRGRANRMCVQDGADRRIEFI